MDTLTKWRLLLGGNDADGTGASLDPHEQGMDAALDALYELERRRKFEYPSAGERRAGSEGSQPAVARWLGDIRRYFPRSVVEVMQKDALQRPALQRQMLLDPTVLEQTTPDVHLVATLLELGRLMPDHTRDTARRVVQQVVDELLQRIEQHTIQALRGALHRSAQIRRPRLSEMDWHTTIRRNLKHYQPSLRTVIPEQRFGFGRKSRRTLRHVVLCLDQSGSMAESVVYSGIFAAVMATLPAVRTRLVAFDTSVVEMTEHLHDPVEVIFGVQLGGGTDINQALGYCQETIQQPTDTILVLISDLFEGGNQEQMRRRAEELVATGVQVVCLLALSDQGAPAYDAANARYLASVGIPVFACTPDRFPDLMAAAIGRQDLRQWAGSKGW